MVLILIVSGFLLVCFIFFVVVLVAWKKRKFSEKDLSYINSHWYRILDSFKHNPKEAVLESDKLLCYCLRKRGGAKFRDSSLGEMLKNGSGFFSDIDSVWFAHKLRNGIAHEMNFNISPDDAKKALSCYKKALTDLGVKL